MKYYKITNKKEKHFGLQYHTGLNVDCLPFRPYGDCKPGGIYFSKEDILDFLNIGPWIREVTLPKGEKIYKNPGTPVKWKAHRVILGPRRKITNSLIEKLIKEGAHFTEDFIMNSIRSNQLNLLETLDGTKLESVYIKENIFNYVIASATLKTIKFLVLKGFNSISEGDSAIVAAIQSHKLAILKYLINLGWDPKKSYRAIYTAIQYGYLDTLKYLVSKGYNPITKYEENLRLASRSKDLNILKYLIALKTPSKVEGNEALIVATIFSNFNAMKYLISKGYTSLSGVRRAKDSARECKEIWRYLENILLKRKLKKTSTISKTRQSKKSLKNDSKS
jgi:hypothetical protein